MNPKTRQAMIEASNARIFSAINALMAELRTPKYEIVANGIAVTELEHKGTTSDDWYELSEELVDPKERALAFKVAQAVLVRNGYRDGLPFCPLCGKLGKPEHNGAPLIDGQVCESCNEHKVIPARVREALTAQNKKVE